MFYLLDKEKGMTSFKAIKIFQKRNNISKVGHTGTLDPLATGLLLIATDEDTKLIDYIDKGFKTYKATMILGKNSDTYDVEGEVVEGSPFTGTKEEIIEALMSFEGTQDQIPPAFSAKRINGKRAYVLAREGKKVILKPSKVTIKDIKNIKFLDEVTVEFDVTVSRGTYIRSLIFDLGKKLECGAIMSELRRTSIGNLTEEMTGKPVSVLDLLTLPLIETNKMLNLINGKFVETNKKPGLYALKFGDDVFGIVEVVKNYIKAKKLMGNKFRKAGF